jgi:hypothetical protein
MARPTRLKVLGSRQVPADVAGEPDDRRVVEVFPRPPAAPEQGSPLAEDILEILRKSHDRISGEVHQATAIATEAMSQTAEVRSASAALIERADKIEAQTARIGETMLAALSDHSDSKTAARQAVAAASLGVIQRLGERLTSLAVFAVDRAPAFLALAAAVWLWSNVLNNPNVMQLIALGLFGGVVVAPSIWLSSRRV